MVNETLPLRRIGGPAAVPHIKVMSATVGHLFTLEILPSRDVSGHFTWAIRDRGKLYRRSDWPHASEAGARAIAEAEMMKLSKMRVAA
jgi:hypothetical protein